MSKYKSPLGGVLVPTLVILVSAAVLAFALVGLGGGSDSAVEHHSAKKPQDQPKVDVDERRDEGDPLALGDVDAPVVMVIYSDFQCPFCGKFARDIEPDLIDEYVDDGTLRIEWRDFPYLGDDSWKGAAAGRAAAAQDKFWQFENTLYHDQPATNSDEMTDEFLADIAQDAGLDVQRFRQDLEAEADHAESEADFKDGQSHGVSAAPTFFINGIPLMGTQPKSAFADVIDSAAAEAQD